MDADVLIVGAGAAGLAAARVFKQAGKPALVLEASKRKGGRALTRTSPFDVPWDMGAHWMHYGDHNPFTRYGRRGEVPFDIEPAPDEYTIFAGSKNSSELSAADSGLFLERTAEVVNALALVPTDHSPHSLLALFSSMYDPWYGSIALMLGNWDMGKDWSGFSNRDYQRAPYYDPYPDYLCRQGYGALVEHTAADIDVQTGTTVKSIKLAGGGVTVVTNNGSLQAKTCIVTVSTGVLAAESIDIERMTPELLQACADVSMGHYERIALHFPNDVFGKGPDRYVLRRVDGGNDAHPQGIVFTTNVAGTNLVFADVGGSFVKDLPLSDKGEMVNFALDELASLLGEGVRKSFQEKGRGTATNWTNYHLTRGAFASPGPGKAEQRDVLIGANIEQRIFFAGEAHHRTEWATVSGAHKSGCETALAVMTLLYGSRADARRCRDLVLPRYAGDRSQAAS